MSDEKSTELDDPTAATEEETEDAFVDEWVDGNETGKKAAKTRAASLVRIFGTEIDRRLRALGMSGRVVGRTTVLAMFEECAAFVERDGKKATS